MPFARPDYMAKFDKAFDMLSLSDRELDMLDQVMLAKPNKQIARDLGITEATVKVHLRSVLAKLGGENRTQLAAWWWDRTRTLNQIRQAAINPSPKAADNHASQPA